MAFWTTISIFIVFCFSFVFSLNPQNSAEPFNNFLTCPMSCTCLNNESVDCSNRTSQNQILVKSLFDNDSIEISGLTFRAANLKYLDLSNNDLSNYDPSFLSMFTNLEILKMENCSLSPTSTLKLIFSASLTQVYLKSNKLQNLPENVLSNSSRLQLLDLSSNFFDEFPSNAASTSLQILNLNNNEIETLPINCFRNLRSLERLSLSRNKIRRFPKDVFVDLPELQFLDLSVNRLRRIPGLSFKGLQNLRSLRLERNGMSSLSDGAFFDLIRLKDLHLNNNKLTGVERGWLYGVENLERLFVAHNLVDHVDAGGWQFCTKLLELDLSKNRLTSLKARTFAHLTHLTNLTLNANRISQIYENAFHSLTNLKHLDLSGNWLSDVLISGQAVFKELTSLETLTLADNRLSILSLGSFDGLIKLKSLDLSANPLTVLPAGSVPSFVRLQINSVSLLCDCRAKWLAEMLSSGGWNISGYLKCRSPPRFRGLDVARVDSTNLTCSSEENETLRFDVQPRNRTTLRGRDFSFECSARCSSTTEDGQCLIKFTWRKVGQLLFSDRDHGYEVVQERVADDADLWRSMLKLSYVDESDSGWYLCQATSESATILSEKAHLTVHVPPKFAKKPSDVRVSLGGTARFECSAAGSPAPVLSWKKDDGDDFPAASERRMHVMPTEDVFFIVNAKTKDSGLYSCLAKSSAGAARAEARLVVMDDDSAATATDEAAAPPVKVVDEWETAVFECNVTQKMRERADGDWRVVWSHDGAVIRNGDDRRRHVATDGKVLVISRTRAADQGLYTCRFGEFAQSARLAVRARSDDSAKKIDVWPQDVSKPAAGAPASASTFDPTSTAGVVVIVVVACVLLTSFVWILVIWRSRRSTAVVLAVRRRSSAAFEAVADVRV